MNDSRKMYNIKTVKVKWIPKLVIVLFTLLITINVSGQSQKSKGENRTNTKVTLLKEINDPKTVILLKKRGFIVKVSFSEFKDHMESWLLESSYRQHYGEKLLEIVLRKAEKNTINISNITDRYLKECLHGIIVELLENGQCLILNKKRNTIISEVTIQKYSYYYGPLFAGGGRRFFINKLLILEIRDWIS